MKTAIRQGIVAKEDLKTSYDCATSLSTKFDGSIHPHYIFSDISTDDLENQ